MTDSEEITQSDGQVDVWGTTEFVPGGDVGLVGHHTFGLIEAGHPGTRDQLWALVAGDSPIDDILDALSANGLKALPSFGLAQLDGDELRVVARGRTLIVAVDAGGSEQLIDPSDVRTWVEEVVSDAVELSIRLLAEDVEDRSSDRFFVLAGSVPASSLTRSFATADPLADAARQGWTPAGQVGADDVAEVEVARTEEGLSWAPQPDHGQAGDELEVGAQSEEVEDESDDAMGSEAGAGQSVEAESEVDAAFQALAASESDADDPGVAPGSPADLVPVDSNETISSRDLDEFEDDAAGSTSAGSGEALEQDSAVDNYDFIYGHTVARSVEGAAVRVDESDENAGGLISAVPASTGDVPHAGDHDGQTNPAAARAGAPQELQGDHDGLTMSRAQLDAMRNAAPTPSPGANEVLAVLCGTGHPNPPQAAACRSCGVALGTARPVSVPRPPLGLLVFSNGDRVVADRSILIGRNPRVSGTATTELPRVVKFEDAGQGLSRTHAEVRLEGWQLLLEDLQSTNGTEVTLPGQTPRRLHAGDPVVLVPGATIDFGEELTCVVEAAQ